MPLGLHSTEQKHLRLAIQVAFYVLTSPNTMIVSCPLSHRKIPVALPSPSVSLERPIKLVRHELQICAGCFQFSCASHAWTWLPGGYASSYFIISPAQIQPWALDTPQPRAGDGLGHQLVGGPGSEVLWPGRAGSWLAGDQPCCAIAELGAGGQNRVLACGQGGRSPGEAGKGWWMRDICTGFKFLRKSWSGEKITAV